MIDYSWVSPKKKVDKDPVPWTLHSAPSLPVAGAEPKGGPEESNQLDSERVKQTRGLQLDTTELSMFRNN